MKLKGRPADLEVTSGGLNPKTTAFEILFKPFLEILKQILVLQAVFVACVLRV